MTPDRPHIAQLLETAGEVLRSDILPDAAGSRKTDILLVLRALEIAGRVFDGGDALAQNRSARYAALPGKERDAAALAAAIRSGEYDATGWSGTVHSLLLEDARERLRLSNPSYLEQEAMNGGTGLS